MIPHVAASLPAHAVGLVGAAYWLPVIAAFVIALSVATYVVLDGFDLGIGILFAVENDDEDRDVMVNTIAPVWDGNETWLVFGGEGLFALFPITYAVLLPAFYPLMIGMLLALIFRGVAFEFRFKVRDRPGRRLWDLAFFGGSFVAAFCQGLTLGGILQGVKVAHGQYAGGWFDWLTPFSICCGLAVVVGYALIGATFLVWKTDGDLQRRVRRHAEIVALATLGFIVLVSCWTPLLHETYMTHWFSWPEIAFVSPVPILVAALALLFRHGIRAHHDLTPFLCTLGIFLLCFAGLGISIWPYMIPPTIDIWQAADPPGSQLFLLVGAAVLIPLIMAYSAYSYYVFRGKVGAGVHYH